MRARSADGTSGIVVRILVKRDAVGGMRIAEDVPTPSTVMPPRPVVEIAQAGRLFADCGFEVGLDACKVSYEGAGKKDQVNPTWYKRGGHMQK